MEAEVREILRDALTRPAATEQLGSRIRQRFATIGGADVAVSSVGSSIGTTNAVVTCLLAGVAVSLNATCTMKRTHGLAFRKASLAATLFALTAIPARYVLADVTSRQSAISPNAEIANGATPAEVTVAIDVNDARITSYVKASSMPTLATSRISNAAGGVIGGINVVPLGGFFGTDPYPSMSSVASMIGTGSVRWVAVPALPPGVQAESLPRSMVATPWGPWVRTNPSLRLVWSRICSLTWGGRLFGS